MQTIIFISEMTEPLLLKKVCIITAQLDICLFSLL